MRMIKAKLSNSKQFVIWGTGSPVREWIYMLDVANIIKQIIDDKMFDTLPNTINLGQQHGTSILETVQTVKELLESSKFINFPIKIKIFSSMKIYNLPDHDFEELYSQLKKSDKFIYYGSINKQRLALEFKSSSFLTYPSTFEETFCITLIDSLAAGMHPVLTDLGALKETSNGFASFLINKKLSFHKDYANLINDEINIKQNNYDLWCENHFNQIKIINEKYNYKNIAQKWINIIKSL
jgi:glycosyltransferase involved in cell wall biosynthesis